MMNDRQWRHEMWLWARDFIGALLLLAFIVVASLWMAGIAHAGERCGRANLGERAMDGTCLYSMELVEIIRIIDGDTMELKGGERARLWGIDAPELNSQYGPDAAEFLYLLTREEIMCARVDRDRWGRTIVRCHTAMGLWDINEQMVRSGFAMDWPNYSDGFYAEHQRVAMEACRGIWSATCI